MAEKRLGDRLREVRKNNGWTLQDLALRLKTTAGFLSEVETNKKIPGGEFLLSLKQYLGSRSIDWLLTGLDTEEIEVYNEDERAYCKKLLRVMRTKQDKTVTAIKQNIEAFLDNPDREKPIAKKNTANE